MRSLMMVLALFAGVAGAAPTVTASQTSVTVGPVHVIPVPAGAVGETLVVFVATESRPGVKPTEAANPGWNASDAGSTLFSVMRLTKVSDGSETSVTVNVAGEASSIALRVSGAVHVGQFEYRAHISKQLISDPPTAYTRAGVQDWLVIALTANASGVAMLPAGYGFPVNAAGSIDLTASFRTAPLLEPSSNEDPGPYSLNAVSKSTAASTLIY